MRKVFSPPEVDTGSLRPILGGLAVTLCCFLVLPLTQLVSSGVHKKLYLSKVDVAAPPPPAPPSVEQPPPPEEEPPEPPEPKMQNQPQQLSLSQLDLDLNVGGGGALASLGNAFADAGAALNQLQAFDVSELDQPPRRVSAVSPRVTGLPKESGVVVAVFVVDENGRVMDPRIESSHRREFEKPVLDALKRWKFSPGTKGGEAVRAYVRQSFPFKFR